LRYFETIGSSVRWARPQVGHSKSDSSTISFFASLLPRQTPALLTLSASSSVLPGSLCRLPRVPMMRKRHGHGADAVGEGEGGDGGGDGQLEKLRGLVGDPLVDRPRIRRQREDRADENLLRRRRVEEQLARAAARVARRLRHFVDVEARRPLLRNLLDVDDRIGALGERAPGVGGEAGDVGRSGGRAERGRGHAEGEKEGFHSESFGGWIGELAQITAR
jgi:hypothetical protein